MKINLCCGDHVLDGWLNCDPRASLRDGITEWRWGRPIPAADGSASIVHVAYGFMYARKQDYGAHLQEIRRVLRSGGTLLVKEDDRRKGRWRKVGFKNDIGVIQSDSDESEMRALIEAARLLPMPGYGAQWEKLLDTHRSARLRSYIIEAWKP